MTNTIEKGKLAPLPRCPKAEFIRVMQFQLFDNIPSKGVSQHTMTLEAYCEDRLNLFKPFWKRTVALIDPRRVMKWADATLEAGGITPVIHECYVGAFDVAKVAEADDKTEFVKMGHIGSKREHIYYDGQFVLVQKFKGEGLAVVVCIDGEFISSDSFLYDKNWRKGSKRRKFFGFYDPNDLYGAMKREQEMREEAERRASLRGQVEAKLADNPFAGYISPF